MRDRNLLSDRQRIKNRVSSPTFIKDCWKSWESTLSGEMLKTTNWSLSLRETGGNQTKAARLLGINRVTVRNRMKKYGIDIRKITAH